MESERRKGPTWYLPSDTAEPRSLDPQTKESNARYSYDVRPRGVARGPVRIYPRVSLNLLCAHIRTAKTRSPQKSKNSNPSLCCQPTSMTSFRVTVLRKCASLSFCSRSSIFSSNSSGDSCFARRGARTLCSRSLARSLGVRISAFARSSASGSRSRASRTSGRPLRPEAWLAEDEGVKRSALAEEEVG